MWTIAITLAINKKQTNTPPFNCCADIFTHFLPLCVNRWSYAKRQCWWLQGPGPQGPVRWHHVGSVFWQHPIRRDHRRTSQWGKGEGSAIMSWGYLVKIPISPLFYHNSNCNVITILELVITVFFDTLPYTVALCWIRVSVMCCRSIWWSCDVSSGRGFLAQAEFSNILKITDPYTLLHTGKVPRLADFHRRWMHTKCCMFSKLVWFKSR